MRRYVSCMFALLALAMPVSLVAQHVDENAWQPHRALKVLYAGKEDGHREKVFGEFLGQWFDKSATIPLEKLSMVTAAGAAAATGVRVFTATSSQGLLYAMEMLYAVAGWRAPFVLVNVSRAVAAPVTLEADDASRSGSTNRGRHPVPRPPG